jgi:two-component system NtrC family response regulator
VERIGGRDSIAVDVRVVCATHRDLQKMIGEGSFREDLYYRISEITVKLPPVREREGDILLLANTLLRRFCQDLNRPVLKFSTDAVAAMEQWRWPGNVREMENRLKRAVILADGMLVSASDLELATADGEPMPFNLREVRDLAERQAVVRALTSSTNNVAQAARLLGVTRPTLYNLINKFHIELDD